MGKKSHHKCYKSGFGYQLDMVFGLVDKFDWVNAFQWNKNLEYTDWSKTDYGYNGEDFNGMVITAQTGKPGDIYKSNIPHYSDMTFYNGTTKVEYPNKQLIPNLTAQYINKVGCVVFKEAFIGDNTTNVPNYQFSVSRWKIYDDDIHQINEGVDPIYVILDLLVNYLEIPKDNIDLDSFQTASNTCKDEEMGISFILTKNKSVLEWIKLILKVIDGVIYYDILTQKWKIFLIRKDDSENVLEINEDNTKNITINTGAWEHCVTTYIFKYTNYKLGKVESIKVVNKALKEILRQDVTKTFNFEIVTHPKALNLLINRTIHKNSKPLSTLKFELNFVDSPNIHLGQIIKVKSELLGIPEMYFRVTKLGGDEEYKPYVEVEAVEDFYRNTADGNLVTEYVSDIPNALSYNITSKIEKMDIIPVGGLFANPNKTNWSETSLIIVGAGKTKPYEIITSVDLYLNNGGYKSHYLTNVVSYGELNSSISNLPKFSRTFEFTLKNLKGKFTDKTLTDEEWQKLNMYVFIDKNIIAVQSVQVDVANNLATFKGVMSGLAGFFKNSYNSGTSVWVFFGGIDSFPIYTSYFTMETASMAYANPYKTGEKTTISKSWDANDYNNPLPPANVKIKQTGTSQMTIWFEPTSRGDLTPTLKSADNFLGGEGEYNFESKVKYEIGANGQSLGITIDPRQPVIKYVYNDIVYTNPNVYCVRAVYDETYYSNWVYAKEIN